MGAPCPKCKSSLTQSLSAICQGGAVNGPVNGYSSNGDVVTGFARNTSLLVASAAPPTRISSVQHKTWAHILMAPIYAVAAFLLSFPFAFIFAPHILPTVGIRLFDNDFNSAAELGLIAGFLFFVSVLVRWVGKGLANMVRNARLPRGETEEEFDKRYNQWRRTWHCHACEHRFVGPDPRKWYKNAKENGQLPFSTSQSA